MAKIHDLMTSDDALEVALLFAEALQEHKDKEDRIGRSFAEAEHRAIFDWEVDLPDLFF